MGTLLNGHNDRFPVCVYIQEGLAQRGQSGLSYIYFSWTHWQWHFYGGVRPEDQVMQKVEEHGVPILRVLEPLESRGQTHTC